MAEGYADQITGLYEAWEAGDPGFTERLHPEIEWDFTAYPLPDVVDRGQGLESFVRFLAEYVESWAEYEAHATEVDAVGDRVLVVLHERIRASDSNVPLERDIFHVWTFRDRMPAGIGSFRTREDALQSAAAAAE
jgi:ketosteroid isomerase-like protein